MVAGQFVCFHFTSDQLFSRPTTPEWYRWPNSCLLGLSFKSKNIIFSPYKKWLNSWLGRLIITHFPILTTHNQDWKRLDCIIIWSFISRDQIYVYESFSEEGNMHCKCKPNETQFEIWRDDPNIYMIILNTR